MNIAKLSGLFAGVLVVAGLTWLFTTNSRTPEAGVSTSDAAKIESPTGSPSDETEVKAPVTQMEAAPASEKPNAENSAVAEAAHPGNGQASTEMQATRTTVAPAVGDAVSAAKSSAESELLAFLEHGSGKEAVFGLNDIAFETGKSSLAGSSREPVELLARVLREYPKAKTLISVETGHRAHEAKLSLGRAIALRKELERLGVAASSLSATKHAIRRRSQTPAGAAAETPADGQVWLRVSKR